jgi:adenylate cyclase
VVSLSYLAGALWHLGFFDQAWRRMDEALRLADRIEQPMSTLVALLFAASLEVLRYDCTSGMRYAQRAVAIATEQRYPYFIATATILRGHFLARCGDVRDGIEEMQRGLAARRATGAIVLHPFYAALLADAYAQLGDCDAAKEVLAGAFTQVAQTGERGYEAELYRLQGVVLACGASESDEAEAESSLLQARNLARAQRTRGWELRAALDLGRLLQRQGRHAEGRHMLEETLSGVSEGFESPDVLEGKRLLAEMRGPASGSRPSR